MLFRSDLWEAVALGIDAENRKIDIFIHHNLSRGIAREALLRSIVVQHTPDPHKVRSGFVYTHDHRVAPSKQCDVLVYNPQIYQPYYQIDEFVVVPQNAATVLVEVKSEIGDRELADLCNMTAYAASVTKPLLGFVYEGWLFDTFCEKITPFANDMSSLPIAIAVHERNYLAIRPTQCASPVYFAIDFSRSNPASPGMATAYFMNVYALLLKNDGILDGPLWSWFTDTLTIVPPEARKWLTADGILHDLTERKSVTAAP
jgi:hypothetical protein